jgi:copper resistance protein B
MKTKNMKNINKKWHSGLAFSWLSVITGLTLTGLITPSSVNAAEGDDPLIATVIFDQFEMRDSNGDQPFVWEGQGWIGKDLNKLWIKTDGEIIDGDTEEAELQALYSRAIAPYWDFQIGARRDFQPTPTRDWAVIGFQGLAPYFFEINTAAFIGDSGRTALRLEAEYELLITQKLILTPDIEVNFYGQNDEETGVGSGLSDTELGLRLRYEFIREIAPYIGVSWTNKYGNTADFSRKNGSDTRDMQVLMGVRFWY